MTTTETHPQLEEVLRLRAQGMSVRAIAAAIGMSRAYVGQLVQGIGTRAPVALDLLDDNPWQPRAAQDAASLEGLAQSILDNGLLQLPGARAQGERFQLAFGHRRRDALKLLHSRGQWGETVTVTLQPFTDEQMAVIAFAENDDRQDLTDIERLRAYRHALDTIEGLTVAGLAAQLKMDRSTLANNLRVLALPQEALEHIAPGELGLHAARTMLPLVGPGHTHLAELRWVLRTLAGDSYGDGRPDWRVKTVEGLVGEVPQRFSQQWRPLFTQGQRAGNPKFDVEAFSLEHQNAVHMLPAGASGTAQPWTCAVSAWSTAQGTVTGTAYGGVDSAVLLYTASTAVVTGPSPPSGLATSRSAASITLSWSAPAGDVDNYAAQREELRVIGGVARWANTVSLGNPWLPASLSYYKDTTIVPSVTYRYRIASVTENAAGDYSEWGNSSPAHFSFGDAPAAFTLDKARDVAYDTHREFWLTWSAVSGATIYELQLRRFSIAPISETSEIIRVSHTDAAITAFSPVSVRVRARGDCSGAPCYTEWTAWNTATFTPKPRTIPVAATVAPGADVMTFRGDIEEIVRGSLGPAGIDPDEGQVVEFAILTLAATLALVSVWIGMRRGAAPLGFGMACATSVLVLFLGYRLLGIPLAWPIAAQILIILPGLYALVRQFGILR